MPWRRPRAYSLDVSMMRATRRRLRVPDVAPCAAATPRAGRSDAAAAVVDLVGPPGRAVVDGVGVGGVGVGGGTVLFVLVIAYRRAVPARERGDSRRACSRVLARPRYDLPACPTASVARRHASRDASATAATRGRHRGA